MRYLKTPDYTYISIFRTGGILEGYFNSPGTDTLKVRFYKVDCVNTAHEVVIPHSQIKMYDEGLLGQLDYLIEVRATDILGTQIFADGVYSVALERINTLDQVVDSEIGCMLIDRDLSDSVYNYQSSNLTSDAFFFFLAVQAGEYCEGCDCQKMCNLYDATLNQIGL